jgi:hypothetical protein
MEEGAVCKADEGRTVLWGTSNKIQEREGGAMTSRTARMIVVVALISLGWPLLGSSEVQAAWWCGPSGSAVSKYIPDSLFRGACFRHDVCYTLKGNDKASCDRGFATEMVQACKSRFRSPLLAPVLAKCIQAAGVYHAAVVFAGGSAYRSAQQVR